MDSEDRSFFLEIFNKFENHLKKTCDELHEVDKNVLELKTDFKNHIQNTNKEEEKNEKKYINNREWLLIGISAIAVLIAIVGFFN